MKTLFRGGRGLLAAAFFLCAFSASASVLVSIGRNFAGSDNSQTLITPADANGAIGPRHFVQFINGTFAVFNKTNGAQIRKIADTKFWGNAGVLIPGSDAVSDPRIIYDSASQRWFASEVDFNASEEDPTLDNDYFLLAVSDTSDPTGSWHGFSFVSDPTQVIFADFPTLGVDANAVYISGDMFYGADNPLGSELVSIPKADLLASPPTIDNRTWYGFMDYSDHGDVLQPATCMDGSGSGIILATADLFDSSSLIASTVLDGNTTNASLTAGTDIAVDAYTGPMDATQPDGTATLAVNDARFSARAYTIGGVVFAVHNVEVDSRAAIRWYRIDATNYALLESGTITDPDLDLFYPSIAANTNGVVVIGCNGSSSGTLISSFAYVGETFNGVTTFGNHLLLASGAESYHDIYEQIGFADESRWGDYSATSVDPVDPNRFWTIQMLPRNDGETWVMQITELITAPLRLTIARAGTNAVVSWPSLAGGFHLQSNTNLLASGSWSPVSQTPSTNGNFISVTVPVSGPQKFFVLQSP